MTKKHVLNLQVDFGYMNTESDFWKEPAGQPTVMAQRLLRSEKDETGAPSGSWETRISRAATW